MLPAPLRSLRVWLANVGANSSHAYASPLFDDGTFELLPIVETPAEAGPHSVRFGDLTSFNSPQSNLSRWVPDRLHRAAAHFDPEFETFTYGDNCSTAPRAAALKKVTPGDLIFFVARLSRWQTGRFTGEASFCLVGFLEVESVMADVRALPAADALLRYRANAHIRRAMNDRACWNGFWVFAGTKRSRRLKHAVPVNREFASDVLLDAGGSRWRWDGRRTELQTIGSYTRSCRCIIDGACDGVLPRLEALRRRVELHNEGVWPD
ncbi:MAG: hypothetical protein HY678_06200 [Chloroflexi bacterium]|nr:hypothetical protein [Chloroflexota bacterium]